MSVEVSLFDNIPLTDAARRTADGYLVTEARVARTGIQIYTGKELGLPDRESIRVYRPEEEVFAADAVKTFAYRPLTLGHPKEMVDAKNWAKHSVGQTGGEIVRDGEFVRVPLVLMDEAAIRVLDSGVRELSMGYTCEIELTDGETPSGEKYDAIQRSLRMNHLAIVAKARGGSDLRIGDGTKGDEGMSDIKTKTVLVDGLPIENTEAGALVIEKLLKDAQAVQTKLADTEAAHAKELAKKDAEIDELKAKVLTDAQIEERAKARADLIAKAQKVDPKLVADGLDAPAIRLAVVKTKLGDAAVQGKHEAYIEARFDHLVEAATSTPDPFKKAVGDGIAPNVDGREKAYEANISHLTDAWKRKEA